MILGGFKCAQKSPPDFWPVKLVIWCKGLRMCYTGVLHDCTPPCWEWNPGRTHLALPLYCLLLTSILPTKPLEHISVSADTQLVSCIDELTPALLGEGPDRNLHPNVQTKESW